MNRLYVLQYDDDPYCAPYCEEIFTNKKSLLKYIKNNDLENLRYLSIYEYDNNIGGYQESTHMYYLDKSRYGGSWEYFWRDYEDKTFIPSKTYHDIINKIKEQYE